MLLVSALLLVIRTMPARDGIGYWLFAAVTQALIYVFAYFSYPSEVTVAANIAFYTLQTLAISAIALGTLKFINYPIHRDMRMMMTAVVIFIVGIACLYEMRILASVIFVAYVAPVLFEVGYRLYQEEQKTVATRFAVMLFFLNGIHWLDYPILGQIDWFVPIGFMIGMVLVVAIFLSLSILALLQFKHNTEESEKKAIEAATHDPLTGLYNRSYLDTLFDQYANEAESINRSFILLYFDLDGFKAVNDTYGHSAGDIVLTTIAKRINKWLGQKGDAVRIGGDELVVLARLRADFSEENSLAAAHRLLHLIEQPIVDGANSYSISASVGGCCYGLPHKDLDEIINEADALMYDIKQSGGRGIKFSQFDATSTNDMEEHSSNN